MWNATGSPDKDRRPMSRRDGERVGGPPPGRHFATRGQERMDSNRFDTLARMVGRHTTRRGALHRLTAAALAAIVPGVVLDTATAAAVEVTSEDFGCSNVGVRCNGRDSKCCSGRCVGQPAQKGRKRRNGKRRRNKPDRSQCEAHDEGGCISSQDTCANRGVIACGSRGRGACFQTTGNAPFCGRSTTGSAPDFVCVQCSRDQDCVNAGYGAGAACVVCPWRCELRNDNATACVGAAS